MERLLLGVDVLNFLEQEGFTVLRSALAKDENGAMRIASGIGFPVALKVSSPDVIHKTEIGGVRVPLNNEDEVRKAFRELTEGNPGKRIDGIMVQELGKGLELIVGMLRDRQFGPVLMCGLGGIFVEALTDVSFRMLPIEAKDAREMIEELKAYSILISPRQKGINLSEIEDFLLKVSRFIMKHREIQEMDLNPVFITQSGIKICDARIKMDSPCF